MSMEFWTRRSWLALTAGALLARASAAEDAVTAAASGETDEIPRPAEVPPVPPEELAESIRRGIDFLLLEQRPNGSWGSATLTKDLNIYALIPGSHDAFKAAVTSMCIAALLEIPREDIAPKRARKAPRLHLNLRTSQVLDFSAAPSLSYEVSRLEASFDDQTEGVAPARAEVLNSAAARRAARLR